MKSLQKVSWGKLYDNATSKATKEAKKGLKMAKQGLAEAGLRGTYTIGGKDVIDLRKLATGGFATVNLVRDIKTNTEYAMKKIKTTQAATQVTNTTEEAEREARLLSKMSHPNIIKCVAWGKREVHGKRGSAEVILLLELCPRGHILTFLKEKVVLSPKDIVDCLFQTLDALHFLHHWQRFPIVHRDVKCENILRAKDGRWKLCDFGSMCCRKTLYPKDLSKKGLLDLQDEIDKKVTMLYRPPEMVDLTLSRDDPEHHWEIGPKVDIWMAGCVCFCLIFGTHPFQDSATPMAIRNAKYYLPRSHANMNNKNMIMLAQWFLSPLPEDRPSTGEALTILEKWQEKPDVFELLPKSTQERLQKSWKLYGVKFNGPDKSSDGVFRLQRFEFESRSEQESPPGDPKQVRMKDEAPGGNNQEIDFFGSNTQDVEKIKTRVSGGLPESSAPPMMNLFDFDDDAEPAPMASGGGEGGGGDFNPFESAQGSDDIPDFFSAPAPSPASGAAPAATSSTMFDPFGDSPSPAAASGGAPNMDDFNPFCGAASSSVPPVTDFNPFASAGSSPPPPPPMASPPIGGFDPFVSASASSAPAPSIPIMLPPTTADISEFNPFASPQEALVSQQSFSPTHAGGQARGSSASFGGPGAGMVPQSNMFGSGMAKISTGSASVPPQGDFDPFASLTGGDPFSSPPPPPAQSPSSAMPSFGAGMPSPWPINQSFGADMPPSSMNQPPMGVLAPSMAMTGAPMTTTTPSPGFDPFGGSFSTPAMSSTPAAQPQPTHIQGSNDFDLFGGGITHPAPQPAPVAASNADAFDSFGGGFGDFNNPAPHTSGIPPPTIGALDLPSNGITPITPPAPGSNTQPPSNTGGGDLFDFGAL